MPLIAAETKEELVKQIHRLKGARDRVQAKAEEVAGQALQTLEVGTAAFGFGYLRKRFAEIEAGEETFEVMGVSPDLLAGVVFHGFGYLGAMGKYDEHAHNVGDGCLASYAVVKGMEFGESARRAAEEGEAATAGRLTEGGPNLTDQLRQRERNEAAV